MSHCYRIVADRLPGFPRLRGQPSFTGLSARFLLADQTGVNRFAQFPTNQVGEAGEYLQQHAHDGQSQPSEDDEAVVQRGDEQFFHEPEGVTPLVQADVRQDHEGASDRDQVRQGQAFAPERQAGLGVQEGSAARDDVDRVAQVELDDVRRGEVGVAHDRLMPGAVLLGEVGSAPVDGPCVSKQPYQVGDVAAQFFAGGQSGQVAVAGLPDVAPQDRSRDDFQHDFDVQEVHPVGFELRRERVEASGPAVNALVPANPRVEHGVDRESERQPLDVQQRLVFRDDATNCCCCHSNTSSLGETRTVRLDAGALYFRPYLAPSGKADPARSVWMCDTLSHPLGLVKQQNTFFEKFYFTP